MLSTLLILAVCRTRVTTNSVNTTSLATSLPVAQWLERSTSVREVMGSIPFGDSDFFFVPRSWKTEYAIFLNSKVVGQISDISESDNLSSNSKPSSAYPKTEIACFQVGEDRGPNILLSIPLNPGSHFLDCRILQNAVQIFTVSADPRYCYLGNLTCHPTFSPSVHLPSPILLGPGPPCPSTLLSSNKPWTHWDHI